MLTAATAIMDRFLDDYLRHAELRALADIDPDYWEWAMTHRLPAHIRMHRQNQND